jgi:hypothetical protein
LISVVGVQGYARLTTSRFQTITPDVPVYGTVTTLVVANGPVTCPAFTTNVAVVVFSVGVAVTAIVAIVGLVVTIVVAWVVGLVVIGPVVVTVETGVVVTAVVVFVVGLVVTTVVIAVVGLVVWLVRIVAALSAALHGIAIIANAISTRQNMA